MRMRSIEASGSGSSSSKTRAVAESAPGGQFTAPCAAGMKAKLRSASALKSSRKGRVKPSPTSLSSGSFGQTLAMARPMDVVAICPSVE